jgi:hypothetical protein
VGQAGPLTADSPPWAAPLFGLELEIDAGAPTALRYQPIPSTPAAQRDLSLLVPEGVTAAQILAEARRAGGALLEQVRVVDEYRGKGAGGRAGSPANGVRSVAFRFTGRALIVPCAMKRSNRACEGPQSPSKRLASPYERPDQAAFTRLETQVRKLIEELGALRSRVKTAEAELGEARSKGGVLAGPELIQVRQRIVDLERENQELRLRLTSAREHMYAVSTRLVFLEDRNEKTG